MFGSLLKRLLFLLLLGFLAFLTIYLNGLSGNIRLSFNESELSISIVMAAFLLAACVLVFLVLLTILDLIFVFVRFLTGDETAISRYFSRSRQLKGNKELSSALISFYEGKSSEALLHSGRAKNLLNNSPLSLLINAQIAQQAGESRLVLENYKKLLKEKDTRLVALSGIISEKIKVGDYGSALKLSKTSMQLNPKSINGINTLFNLQLQEKDWVGARQTLQSKRKVEKISRDTFLRQEAILIFAEAKEKRAKGLTKEALALALSAVRQYPSFVAGLSLLTELELMSGNRKRIERLLKKGWASFPHPDIAKLYKTLVENENDEDRRVRLQALTKINETSVLTKLLKVELHLAVGDFLKAKELILNLIENDPDNYTLTLMAVIEKKSGADDSVVRDWLTKAVYAPKSFSWICQNCSFQTEWAFICPECDGFDTMRWRRPPFYSDHNETESRISLMLESEGSNNSLARPEFVEPEKDYNLKSNKKETSLKVRSEGETVKRAREIS